MRWISSLLGVLGPGGWLNPTPLEVQTVCTNGSTYWTASAYSSVSADGLSGNGTVVTPGGSLFFISDVYKNDAAVLELTRSVTVLSGGAEEYAFSSQFSLLAPPSLRGVPRELFVPGVAYQNVSAVPTGALAGDPLAAVILIREDRLPLPLALAYYASARASAQLAHLQPNGSTVPGEDFTARIVDERLQFGSLGFLNSQQQQQLALAFQYPGSEGDRTYVYSPSGPPAWANRSHPVRASFAHAYTLQFKWTEALPSYYSAARAAWRGLSQDFSPTPPAAHPTPAQVYRDGMDVLAAYGGAYSGVPSMPFEAALASGQVTDTSSQMGFVGRALPAAALLLLDACAACAAPNASRAAAAAAIVDLWAAQAPTACGAVKTWYNINAGGGGGGISWRSDPIAYQGALRIMCDGMLGIVDAWSVSRDRPAWLAAAVGFGDFLLRVQAGDGSLARAYDWRCAPVDLDTRATPFAIPFLLALHAATGDARYLAAAGAAGSFALHSSSAQLFAYVGGAVDNSDITDKEAGWLSAQAFLLLYEATGEEQWLEASARAATFAESFIYLWNVPVACQQAPPPAFPCSRTTVGASLIATGQSGADNFMAAAWWDYQRLGEALGDAHFLGLAALLQNATSALTDWDGTLGYAAPGLLGEAFTLSVRRGAGVRAWLPWLTVNLLHPLVQQMQNRSITRP